MHKLGTALFCSSLLLPIPGSAETFSATNAVSDPVVSPYDHQHGLTFSNGPSYGFDIPGLFDEDELTATLTGEVYDLEDKEAGGYAINFTFSNPTTLFTPKLELLPIAYTMIDPTTWRAYQTWGGTLTGIGLNVGHNFVVIGVETFPLQIGQGANGKNLLFGASGWFAEQGQMIGDVNIVLTGQPSGTPHPANEPSTLLLMSAGLLLIGRLTQRQV